MKNLKKKPANKGLRGYILNRDLTILGMEPGWAKVFACAYDAGLNTASKLHRGFSVMIECKDLLKDIRSKDNEEQLKEMARKVNAIADETTDEKLLPYPLAKAIGRKVKMVNFQLTVEDDNMRKRISNAAAEFNMSPSELISNIVRKYADRQRKVVAVNE